MKLKNIIGLSLCLAFTTVKYGQKPENDLRHYNLNGNVKSVKKIYFNAVDSLGIPIKVEKTCIRYNITDFNLKGYNTEKRDYKKVAKLKRKLIIKFDQKGNKIELSDYGHKENLNSRLISEYNADNRLTLEKHQYFYSNGSSEQALSKFIYNKRGELIEKKDLGFSGFIEARIVYKYDKQKGLTEQQEEYNSEGILSRRTSEYHKKTKQIVIEYFTNGVFDEKEISSFNSKNLVIKKVRTDIDNNIRSSKKYKYDKYGNKTEEILKDHNSEYHNVYSYEYDKHNNWIKEITFINGSTSFIVEREIQYY